MLSEIQGVGWYVFHSGHGVGSNSFKDLIDFGNLVSGKIIQKSDPSLRWVWATGCLRPGQDPQAARPVASHTGRWAARPAAGASSSRVAGLPRSAQGAIPAASVLPSWASSTWASPTCGATPAASLPPSWASSARAPSPATSPSPSWGATPTAPPQTSRAPSPATSPSPSWGATPTAPPQTSRAPSLMASPSPS